MSIVDDAITRVQQIALAVADETIRTAPQYPPNGVERLPMTVTYIARGTASADDITAARLLFTLRCEIHVTMQDGINYSYKQLQAIIPEFTRRLWGDPTLNSTVDTINGEVSFNVNAVQWNDVQTVAAIFDIPVKFRKVPLT